MPPIASAALLREHKAKLEYSRRILNLVVCGYIEALRFTVVVDERAILLLCSCNGFCGASEPEAGAHVTCRLADGYLERIRRFFSNL